MILPDNAFFELLRSVVGKIKTPYSKQVLLGELEIFLQRDDIKKNIACYIDNNDSRIIAAVAALNEPVPGNLETFFAGELSYAELHDLVINLEERFILYRFFDDKQSHLALNPVLESVLMPFVTDSSLLFPSVSVDEVSHDESSQGNKHAALFDDRILAALLSYVSQNKIFFRAGGGIRKKVFNTAKITFPNLESTGLPLETIIGGLQVLGLFFAEGETLVPDYHRFDAFGNLNGRERLIYWAAGILCSEESITSPGNEIPVEFSPWLFRAKVRDYAKIINYLLVSLDPERLYPYTTLRKMVTEYASAESGFINVMEKIGLIVQVSDKYWRKGSFNQASSKNTDAAIVMDTPFSFLASPEIAYDDIIKLAAFSGIVEAGMTVRFELSRDSVVSAFDRDITATEIIDLLQRLSHNRIEESVVFTLGDWEKRHGEVALRRGLVLTLSPAQRYLAETKPLARLITETLAPGVYMLSESAEDRVSEVLGKAGVAIIAHRGSQLSGEESPGGSLRNFFLPLNAPEPGSPGTLPVSAENTTANAASAPTLIEGFHSILKGMRLGEEERDELTARINRRLVLCESQLKGAIVRYEKLEARGLDYAGKALIAKQAVALQSPVEITWPGRQKQEYVFGIPKALEKADGETILVIVPYDGEDEIRLPLGKISLLRRIKKSIFEG
jgi:hypothetical protein